MHFGCDSIVRVFSSSGRGTLGNTVRVADGTQQPLDFTRPRGIAIVQTTRHSHVTGAPSELSATTRSQTCRWLALSHHLWRRPLLRFARLPTANAALVQGGAHELAPLRRQIDCCHVRGAASAASVFVRSCVRIPRWAYWLYFSVRSWLVERRSRGLGRLFEVMHVRELHQVLRGLEGRNQGMRRSLCLGGTQMETRF